MNRYKIREFFFERGEHIIRLMRLAGLSRGRQAACLWVQKRLRLLPLLLQVFFLFFLFFPRELSSGEPQHRMTRWRLRQAVVSVARSLVGRFGSGTAREQYIVVEDRRFRNDCSGVIHASYSGIGMDLSARLSSYFQPGRTGIMAMYYFFQSRRSQPLRPLPGDIVFFDNTWDRAGDGKLNDRLTHAGIVTEIEPDGTIYFVHYTTHLGIVEQTMNLRFPSLRLDENGKEINAALRVRRETDPPGTKYRTGELFNSFGRLIH